MAEGGGGELRRAVAYGWMPLVALAATTALEAGERITLAHAVDGLKEDFGISNFQVGLLPFAMTLVGVVGSFPMGILADRMKRTLLLAVALAIWTVSMGLNGLATGYAMLFATRLMVGAVEANGPAAISLLSDYYPVRNRARIMGLYQLGSLAGAVFGLIAGGVAVAAGGWRWAFWMWVPIGVAVTLWMLRVPEPRRGDQDADFEADLSTVPTTDVVQLTDIRALLPEPNRVAAVDYASCSQRQVLRELMRIPSMWFGVFALTISQLLTNGLTFWGIEYFEDVHGLSETSAGAVTGLLALGSVAGFLGGGWVSDRWLRRGHLNARVYVVAFASMAATVLLVPALYSTNLAVTAPLLFLGGVFLTAPIPPAEAMTTDVVVPELRGRAATVRSVVRSISAVGAPLIGLLADGIGIRMALVAFCPAYAIGGVVMLAAARHYPADLAFVVAHARRQREAEVPGVPGAGGVP